MNVSQATMNFADKVAVALIIARTIERQKDDLTEALVSRYGVEAAWLASDAHFLDQLHERVKRNADTGVWWSVESVEDDEWDWA